MKIEQLPSYSEIIQSLNKKHRQKHLLFGNGFSISYDRTIFSYNALSSFVENIDDDTLKKLFARLDTKNFEVIMHHLDNFIEIADIFGIDKPQIENINTASSKLRQSLIDAVHTLHPEHVFTIPEEKSKNCLCFLDEYLNNGGCIFSTNYDLLLYWVLRRNESENDIDGFGRELETDFDNEYIPETEQEWSELRWGKHKSSQNIFYLHGALLLFDTGIHIIKEEYDNRGYLLENINKRVRNKEYPIFVTGGSSDDKMHHISHNKYLSYCYERLTSIEGSLVTLGFNFGDYDTHIIDAVNIAAHQGKRRGNKLHSIYIGVYSDADLQHINSIEKKFKCKVNKYNARTANIWG